MTDRNYPSVCVEKLYPFERYRISAGPDTGYGATLGVYETVHEAHDRAHCIGSVVFLSATIKRELGQEAAQ